MFNIWLFWTGLETLIITLKSYKYCNSFCFKRGKIFIPWFACFENWRIRPYSQLPKLGNAWRGVHWVEIRLSQVSMALNMDTTGLSSQPSKHYFRRRKQHPEWMQTDVRRERQCNGAAAVPSPGTDPVLRPKKALLVLGRRERQAFTYSWESSKVWKNTMLMVTCC